MDFKRWIAGLPVIGARLVDASGALYDLPVSGGAVPVSAASLPLPAGAATQATLASVLAALTPYPAVNSWDTLASWKQPGDPTAEDLTHGQILNAAFLDGAMCLFYLGTPGQLREVEVFVSADAGAAHNFAINVFEGWTPPTVKNLADYVTAWPKRINRLRVAANQDDGVAVERFPTEAPWVLVVVSDALGSFVAPAVAAQVSIVSRRVA